MKTEETPVKSIMVDGVEYVPKNGTIMKTDGLEYVIIRTYSAGVFAGYLSKREGREVVLVGARRLWYWKGAASLSQLAVDGVSKPKECKFAVTVPSITLTEAIEIIPCSTKSFNSIQGVGEWKA